MRGRIRSWSLLVLVTATLFLTTAPNFARAQGSSGGYYGGYAPYYGHGYGYLNYPYGKTFTQTKNVKVSPNSRLNVDFTNERAVSK